MKYHQFGDIHPTTVTKNRAALPPIPRRVRGMGRRLARPDATHLRALATRFADGQLKIPVAASDRLADAVQALALVAGGHAAGAVVLTR